ncbi:hypothetical protein BDN70DRAFT_915354 [Pholiota conissans]|uniref:PEBP-like protein n=1 Tax=Pholiota conissans TaxID=109636 RepID=A0A9P5YTH7_9AGAR|nr:hypothetical protein BDN70DRAFT_915354 [Pholiota conissans]
MKFSIWQGSGMTLLASCLLVSAQETSLVAVKKAFDKSHIPGNISLTFEPKVLLEVTFPQTVPQKPITLHAGVQLPRNATGGPPNFNIIGPIGHGPFVVAAVDLDAPTPQAPTSAQIRHFLGGNFFTGLNFKSLTPSLLRNATPAISEFRQPTPPAGSDPHRYFNDQTLVTPNTSVALFNISQFASAVGLGQPIGGTFMLVGPPASA